MRSFALLLFLALTTTLFAVEWRGTTPVIIYKSGSVAGSGGMTEENITKLRASGMTDDVVTGIIDSAKSVAVSEPYIAELEKAGAGKSLADALRKKLSVEYQILKGKDAQKLLTERGGIVVMDSNGYISPYQFDDIGSIKTMLLLKYDAGNMMFHLGKWQENPSYNNDLPLPIDKEKRLSGPGSLVSKIEDTDVKIAGWTIDEGGAKQLILAGRPDFTFGLTATGVLSKVSFVGTQLLKNQQSLVIGVDPGLVALIAPRGDDAPGKGGHPTIQFCSMKDNVISPLTKESTVIMPPDDLSGGELNFLNGSTSDVAVADVDSDGKNEVVLHYRCRSSQGYFNLFYVYRSDGTLSLLLGSIHNPGQKVVTGTSGLFIFSKDKPLSIFAVTRK